MKSNGFFDQPKPGSAVKAAIVSKYFWAWAKVLHKPARRKGLFLQYLDLFAGPGCYDDGTASTPVLVLQKAINDASIRPLLLARLNDIDRSMSDQLLQTIQSLPGIESLHHPPLIENEAVDEAMTRRFESMTVPPTLSFIDPWGYKGLSARLIRALTKDWGCDCIFFFNYNRVNLALSNPYVTDSVDELFGKNRADNLRGRLEGLSSQAREEAILAELKQAITEGSRRRAFQFAFKFDGSDRTSHYLLLTTKEPVGFEIMKKIMAGESSDAPQGVPVYQFNPAHLRQKPSSANQLTLFGESNLSRPLEALQQQLLEKFAERSISMIEVYREFNRLDDRYIPRNCKDALLALEASGRITCEPPAIQRPVYKGTPSMADWVRVTFPMRTIDNE